MAVSRVALVRCSSYYLPEVRAAIERGIDLLGGISAFATSGETILLKPNLLSPTSPDQCVITHPTLMEGMALLLKESGAQLTYGDSPGIPFVTPGQVAKKTGFAEVAGRHGIRLADFANGRPVSNPGGTIAKGFMIARGVLEADGVISLPKLKAHGLTRFTGAIKNQYGCVPGVTKGENHVRYPDVREFSALLVDLTLSIMPRLYVMDAVMAMEGNGPNSGDPKRLDLILLSTDPVALDAVACRIIDLDPSFVPTTTAGVSAGLGVADMKDIALVGDTMDSFVDRTFKVVRRAPVILSGNPALRRFKAWTARRPRIIRRSCTRCATCIKSCPVNPKAIDWNKEDRSRPPIYDYARCIGCFCCQETCPSRAIVIKTPFLGCLMPVLWLLGGLISRSKKLFPFRA